MVKSGGNNRSLEYGLLSDKPEGNIKSLCADFSLGEEDL